MPVTAREAGDVAVSDPVRSVRPQADVAEFLYRIGKPHEQRPGAGSRDHVEVVAHPPDVDEVTAQCLRQAVEKPGVRFSPGKWFR